MKNTKGRPPAAALSLRVKSPHEDDLNSCIVQHSNILRYTIIAPKPTLNPKKNLETTSKQPSF